MDVGGNSGPANSRSRTDAPDGSKWRLLQVATVKPCSSIQHPRRNCSVALPPPPLLTWRAPKPPAWFRQLAVFPTCRGSLTRAVRWLPAKWSAAKESWMRGMVGIMAGHYSRHLRLVKTNLQWRKASAKSMLGCVGLLSAVAPPPSLQACVR